MAYAQRSSAALDYNQVERKEQQKRQLMYALPENQQVKKRAGATPYGKLALIFGSVFAVAMVIIACYMQMSELTTQNDRLRDELAEMQSNENALNAKLERMYNLTYVEDYAKNNLGMVKLDNQEVQYVEMANPETTVIAQTGNEEEAPSVFAGLLKSFNVVVEYLN